MVVRLRNPCECDEQDIVAALTLDPARADDAMGIGNEHGLQENGRHVGGCTCRVVTVVRIEGREIELIDADVYRVREGTQDELLFEHDHT